MLANVVRSMSRAHEAVQRETIPSFFSNFSKSCPFRTGSRSIAAEKQTYARNGLANNLNMKSEEYDTAWIYACKVEREKARSYMCATPEYVLELSPNAFVPAVWY